MRKAGLKSFCQKILIGIVFMQAMCLQVYAAELELEPKAYIDNNPFKFRISDMWTSKGKTILSYDVSENGQIAMLFSDSTIGVFDNEMNFSYQLSFENSGSAGVLWLDEKLMFINLRTDTAVVCGSDGMPESFYKITGPDNYFFNVVEGRLRKRGDDRYYCTIGSGGNSPLIHYGFYTILKRMSGEGEEEILYQADALFDRAVAAGKDILPHGLFPLVVAVVVVAQVFRKKGDKK